MHVRDGKPGCARRANEALYVVFLFNVLPLQALAIGDPTLSSRAIAEAKLHSRMSAATGYCLVKCRTQSFIATTRQPMEGWSRPVVVYRGKSVCLHVNLTRTTGG